MKNVIIDKINESIDVKNKILADEILLNNVYELSKKISSSIKAGGKVVICGNGGSASDALHFAGEIVGRFQKERKSWPAVVLNADVATMTAIANDYGYDDVFARQAEAHTNSNDVFIGISTSGNSENVYRAIAKAKEVQAYTAALLGKDGGKIRTAVDCPLIVTHSVTARVQEVHILLIHIICELVEIELTKEEL